MSDDAWHTARDAPDRAERERLGAEARRMVLGERTVERATSVLSGTLARVAR